MWENSFIQPTDFKVTIFCNESYRNHLKNLKIEITPFRVFETYPEEAARFTEKTPGFGIKQRRV